MGKGKEKANIIINESKGVTCDVFWKLTRNSKRKKRDQPSSMHLLTDILNLSPKPEVKTVKDDSIKNDITAFCRGSIWK